MQSTITPEQVYDAMIQSGVKGRKMGSDLRLYADFDGACHDATKGTKIDGYRSLPSISVYQSKKGYGVVAYCYVCEKAITKKVFDYLGWRNTRNNNQNATRWPYAANSAYSRNSTVGVSGKPEIVNKCQICSNGISPHRTICLTCEVTE